MLRSNDGDGKRVEAYRVSSVLVYVVPFTDDPVSAVEGSKGLLLGRHHAAERSRPGKFAMAFGDSVNFVLNFFGDL